MEKDLQKTERDKLKDSLITYKHGNFSLRFALDAVDKYCESLTAAKPLVSGALPLDDFISEVERMQKLYSNSRYISAEQLRDKLAEQLDDIMRMGGNDR